jgi:hypothetical protein
MSVGNITKRTASCAFVSHDKKRGYAGCEAFVDVRAAGFSADRVKPALVNYGFAALISLAVRGNPYF